MLLRAKKRHSTKAGGGRGCWARPWSTLRGSSCTVCALHATFRLSHRQKSPRHTLSKHTKSWAASTTLAQKKKKEKRKKKQLQATVPSHKTSCKMEKAKNGWRRQDGVIGQSHGFLWLWIRGIVLQSTMLQLKHPRGPLLHWGPSLKTWSHMHIM